MDSWAKQMEVMQKKAAEKLQKKAAEASSVLGLFTTQGLSPDAPGEDAGAGAEESGADSTEGSKEATSDRTSAHLLPAGPAVSRTPAMHALTGTSMAPSPFTSHASSANLSRSHHSSERGSWSTDSPVDAEGAESSLAIPEPQPAGIQLSTVVTSCLYSSDFLVSGREAWARTQDWQQ